MYCQIVLVLSVAVVIVSAIPEPGKWQFNVQKKNCNYFHVNKALFKGSSISLNVFCDPSDPARTDMKIKVGWTIRQSPCFEEYIGPDISMPDYLRYYYGCPASLIGDYGYDRVHYLKTKEVEINCDHLVNEFLVPETDHFVTEVVGGNDTHSCTYPSMFACDATPPPPLFNYINFESFRSDPEFNNRRKKRDIMSIPLPGHRNNSNDRQIYIPSDGVYLFILNMRVSKSGDQFNASVTIEMKGEHGYLSANDAPLLTFYGFMCAIYVIYAFAWLIVSAMQWRDLLRIQFWIAAVIFLGMLEKAMFFAEYQSINNTGYSVKGAILFAEIISCLKRTLARMLVIIVSLGYGIVKPRLGQVLHKVVLLGFLYFTLSVLEVSLRIFKPKNEPANQTLMADIPLALLDSIICYWIFSSLVQTMRTLRLRRNVIKLKLYRKFTNCLIICVIISFLFMICVIKQHKITVCLMDWQHLWLDQAFWHILFSGMLLVIMILWRPTNNNQRYAFTQLLDETDDEDEPYELITSLYNGLKIRQNMFANEDDKEDIVIDMKGKPVDETYEGTEEDAEDVRWSKQNVGSSLVEAALPVLVDSEDELMNARFERNKME